MSYVNQSLQKKDAMALVTGQPVYTDDLAPKECLIIKILRSPYANAWIEEIKTENAKKTDGIACVLTWEDVPKKRFASAGQTYPEFSPYDRLILDQHLRFVGDAVAIVAGETEAAVDLALKRIKVKYRVETPVLDMHTAKDNPVLVHPEENWESKFPVGADNKRNLAAKGHEEMGDIDAVLASCKYTVDEVYHTKADQQCMMETFRAYCTKDHFGRLNVVASTQVPFHLRRILGNALGIPSSKIRVIKPRIGGGFGAKQTEVCEIYPAIVTWLTGRPSKIVYSRHEALICASPRHEMEVHVQVGADENGIVKGIKVEALSNAGAYRGYGATQGIYAVESAVNELAHKMNMDPARIRELNMPVEGERMYDYDGNLTHTASCTMDRCLARAKEMIGWNEKYPCRDMGNGKVRGVGLAMAMQGSSISNVDVGGATLKLNEDASYTLSLGCADMGTGCDTILSQMAADCLETEFDNVVAFGVDTDVSPYDSGSYASATTYATGNAVINACSELKKRIIKVGAGMLGVDAEEAEFDGKRVYAGDKEVSLQEVAYKGTCGNTQELQVTTAFSSKISPPPYMIGAAEVEVDKETGNIELIDYVAVVDCGTPINPNLARVQTEGGVSQGIGMALMENVQYSKEGKIRENSFMQYKIPSRVDIGNIRVEFESSYEKSGPFGAKSIGELVIDTPCPAIADAVYNASGVRVRELPITPEKVAMGILKAQLEGENHK